MSDLKDLIDWTSELKKPVREPSQEFINTYNVLLECLVRLNVIEPGARTRLDAPENNRFWDVLKKESDWVNKIVQRVVRLRVEREDEGATAVIDMAKYEDVDRTMFYRCVCLRSDGTKEKWDGTVLS